MNRDKIRIGQIEHLNFGNVSHSLVGVFGSFPFERGNYMNATYKGTLKRVANMWFENFKHLEHLQPFECVVYDSAILVIDKRVKSRGALNDKLCFTGSCERQSRKARKEMEEIIGLETTHG